MGFSIYIPEGSLTSIDVLEDVLSEAWTSLLARHQTRKCEIRTRECIRKAEVSTSEL